ncbi:glucan ABC transporter ATP-binding protein/ permease [Reyranella sp.]|jgi:ATP-binding cassette subfamily B protein|uniref:glucan ABC transporter ATP-binding protein/ permease n=1 Tax=Reyranella sp. TaxID=1929291 RepID=UPI000BC49D76|nr:glucan ABC transporter ATP-binding protein/ permease [Reyranella sp.]OYY34263.1 MAG: cyclic beta-1,2-glucan ABC transporter [Rhodospirillales bacterium 35-66-84]OYZ90924.1 MAG: cyclic beta-1,2-glucan ABC transporter [Rhodospirillales bacterium 24-66-33]OZB21279.1 MAG: cyclic beta-1,2-glucan ABC transporter [Rhodospirillales bacterium 39-66-50]HQS19176.1 glucan ABC transporter ATP-binding protein/ permease [Reyranella sp.]HQT15447.1 glucan ABC transporter ATP-binding protein/ permease [Reyra
MEFFRVYGRVIGLLRAEKGLAITLAIANIAVAGLQFYEPVLFGRVIDLLSTARDRPVDLLWRDAREILGLWALVGIGGIVANMVVSLQADRMAHRRRLGAMATYFQHLLMLPFSFHNAQHSGRLIKIMLTGVDNLFGIWLSFFRENLATLVALFVMLPLSLFMNWRLGLLLLVLILFFAVTNVWVVSRTDRLQKEVEDLHSELAGRAGDALGNISLIQSFVRLGAETSEMHRIIGQTLQAQFPVLNWWALLSVMTRAASTVTVIAIFVLGTWLYTRNEATVGEIVSFMGFATMLIGRMDQASGFVSRIFFQMPSLGDFFRVLDSQSSVPDKPNGIDIGRARGDVEFDDINFSYDGKRPALVHFSLKVPAGATVAFVGPTGAGKSTALSLLHRMWDAQTGVIRIDGVDHRDIKLESLRRNIGVVFQDSTMFYRSIADNLRIGKPDATQAELEEAAKLAEAHDFIMRQPQGYETLVGERGTTLSGGERQRLAIARALLKNPPILILDEATSALDSVTEARIQKALKILMQGRTTFVIAHRLSTIRDADQVVVFEHGRVVEQGGYQALLAERGAFARLVATQQAGIESA